MKNINLNRRNIITMAVLSVLAGRINLSDANTLRQSNITDEEISRAVLALMAAGRPAGKMLQELVLGGLQLELWDLKTEMVYFSLPKNIEPSANVFKKLLKNPSLRTLAVFDGEYLNLGDLRLTRTKEKFNLVSIKSRDIYFNPERVIDIKFKNATYSLPIKKMAAFMRNEHIYSGIYWVRNVPPGVERPSFINHGVLVCPGVESTLKKFVDQLTRNKNSKAEKVQSLLDFVTDEIAYDKKEFYFGREYIHRFSETLTAREGDCSNKSILFASMLEQIEVEYLLVYTINHIYVAVEQAEFQNQNSYAFKFNKKLWFPAETTAPGFKIGISQVKEKNLIKKVRYVQNPKLINHLFTYPEEKLIMFN